jgi:phage host-nuclease inhibitor protein Gam
MQKTVTTEVKPKAEQKKEQQVKDKKRAENLMIVYADLKDDLDKINQEYADKCAPFKEEYEGTIKTLLTPFEDRISMLTTSIESAKKELLEIGDRQKTIYFKDGNWHFENGYYLHIKSETVVKTSEEFSLYKFVKKFGEYVDVKFKIKELKKIFTDGDKRKKFTDLGMDLAINQEVEIKKKADAESTI